MKNEKHETMKAKILQSGYYNGQENKLVCLCNERDIPLFVYLRFEDYVAI
jgi:hypothetical protein